MYNAVFNLLFLGRLCTVNHEIVTLCPILKRGIFCHISDPMLEQYLFFYDCLVSLGVGYIGNEELPRRVWRICLLHK